MYENLIPGASFTIREGRKIVGKGKIESKIKNNIEENNNDNVDREEIENNEIDLNREKI